MANSRDAVAQRPYRELTVATFVFGTLIGAVMTASFVYIGLKLGFTMPGSTVAAILGFAMLRGLVRTMGVQGAGSVVENNIGQTIASGVNTAAPGVVFTLPALFILGLADPALTPDDPLPVALAAIAGSFLGIVVIIPLRKQMLEFERLRFPSGIAVGSLLRSPGAGARQAMLLGGGFAVAMLIHALSFDSWLLPEKLPVGEGLGVPAYFPVTIGISFASLGAGLLSGRGGLPFVFGGILAWWVISPLAVNLGWVPTPADMELGSAPEGYEGWSLMGVLYSHMLRPVGIGVLIGGALAGVIASFPALKSAIGSLSRAAQAKGMGGSDELSTRVLGMGIAASFGVLFVAALLASPEVGAPRALLIALVGTIWLAFAGLIVAQATGMTDISPISGMSLIGVTLMFFLSGKDATAAIILGVAVSIGIGQCADMMSDLKSGHLVGAKPRRQQLAQFAVAWLGVPVALGTLYLLWHEGGGFGPLNEQLSAPQGTALAAVIGDLQQNAAPLDKYVAGTAIGLGVGVFPISGAAVLLGLAMYLPFYITFTYGIGCFVAIGLQKRLGHRWIGHTLVPVAAGFIIGEALTNLTAVLAQLAMGSA